MMITRTSTSPFQPIENVLGRWLFELEKAPTSEKTSSVNDEAEPEVKGKPDKEEVVEKHPEPTGSTRKRPTKKSD